MEEVGRGYTHREGADAIGAKSSRDSGKGYILG